MASETRILNDLVARKGILGEERGMESQVRERLVRVESQDIVDMSTAGDVHSRVGCGE